jgi:DNA-binding NarL/FixJ family response regulator
MIHLLLVDDQNLICQGLKAMLELEPDLEVVGMANNGEEAISLLERFANGQMTVPNPDLILMDVRMPVMDGRTATREICRRFLNVKVIVLSTFDDDQYITDSIRAGAKGYLLKDMPSDELVQAIRLAHRGYTQLGPGLLDKLMSVSESEVERSEIVPPEASSLTPREQDVLRLLGDGATNREIAQELYIAEGTVKTYVTHLLSRFNLRNRTQLAIFANSMQIDKDSTCK